jgi:hypothetical protein
LLLSFSIQQRLPEEKSKKSMSQLQQVRCSKKQFVTPICPAKGHLKAGCGVLAPGQQ